MTIKTTMGRPPMAVDEKRSLSVRVMLTIDEHRRLLNAASAETSHPAAFARKATMDAVTAKEELK